MRQINQTIYTFDELSEQAKNFALNDLRYTSVEDNDWYSNLLDPWKDELTKAGFTNAEIRFSGFGSQGDGASFTSGINLEKFISKMSKDLTVKYTKDKDLFFAKCVNIPSRYVHENTCRIEVVVNEDDLWTDDMSLLEKEINAARFSFCKNIYKSLESSYDDLTSDKAVKELIELAGHEFTKSGEIWITSE